MFTTFQTALSALNATSKAIDVTGNNLANLNTVGFKQSGVTFRDMVTQSFGSSERNQAGVGTRPQTYQSFTQGPLQTTSGALDAAIQGDGFFVLNGPNNSQLLSRAGNFHSDKAGTLVSVTGAKVQGWTQLNADGTVNTNGPIGDIQLPTGSLRQPRATQNFSLDLNLNAAAVVGEPNASYSQPVSLVDSLGNTQTLSITFTKTASNAWSYAVNPAPGTQTTAPTAPLAKGNLTFDANGVLTAPAATPPSTVNQIAITVAGLADGAADLKLNWGLSNPAGASRIGQIAQPNAVSATTQDGTAAAQLSNVSIGDGGVLTATFSNGQQQVVGTLAMASVRNPESLNAVGDNNFQVSAETSPPVIGISQTGDRGNIVGGSLEASSVDIAKEFTNLIVYQRGYQANAKVINTEDQLSQETIGIKQ